MADHFSPSPRISRFLRQRQAEAELAALRKLEREAATDRRIRREAEADARRAQALAMRQAGATFAAIGAAFGLSLEQARQIVHKAERIASDPNRGYQLPMRAANFLKLAGFLDLPEAEAAAAVAKMSRREVLARPNVGKGAVAALVEWIARHGHTFSEDAVMSRKRPLPTDGRHDQPPATP
jgi:hypothetical protein